jgi:8-amino-3,8-dideoxy-alpha-D-manno-octulosonate transaminase
MKIGTEELLEILSLWPLSAKQQEDIKAVIETEGTSEGAWLFRYYGKRESKVMELENWFAEACGARHAIAVNSGTSALIAGLAALGIGVGDDVLIPAYTFIATASAAVIAGAVPNLVEIDESLTIDVEDLERKITPRTRAIIPVHMCGRSSRMDSILAIARERGLRIIEDVAQCCGGEYRGKWLGTFGDVGCFSFDQYKIVNAGEGGMVVTDDDMIATRVRSYHDGAGCWRPDQYAKERMAGELFPGENYRMSELHGAVALAQVRKLSGFLSRCRSYRRALTECLEPAEIDPVIIAPSNDNSGETSEWFVLFAPTAKFAKAIVHNLRRLGDAVRYYPSGRRDWHIYCWWDHILHHSTANRTRYPYSCYPIESLNHSFDTCPRTLSILERAVFLNVPALVGFCSPSSVQRGIRAAIMTSKSQLSANRLTDFTIAHS